MTRSWVLGLRVCAVLGALCAAACGSDATSSGSEEPSQGSGGDGMQGGDQPVGGSAGSDEPGPPASGGAGGSGSDPSGPDQPDAPGPDAGAGMGGGPVSDPPDGSAGSPPISIGPPMGGPGCGADSLCLSIRNTYAELIQASSRCSSEAPDACSSSVPGSLGCGGCPVWVSSNTEELQSLAAQFQEQGCQDCVYGSPTGDRCHPVICADPHMGVCGAAGTCENQEPICPDAPEGKPCDDDPIYCTHEGGTCICVGEAWLCS